MSHEVFSMFVFLAVFLGIAAVLLYVSFRTEGDVWRGVNRLRRLSDAGRDAEEGAALGQLVWSFLSRSGAMLLPGKEKWRARMEARLTHAGLYNPGAARTFLGIQFVLAPLCALAAVLGCSLSGRLSLPWILLAGVGAAAIGTIAPGLWIDSLKRTRQRALRRALPDALDLLVLCLEGGGSLPGAIQRVAEDLEMAHPILASEWAIIQREMHMGLSAGDSVKRFGERCDLEDVRDLASVLLQSERFGVGMAKALRLHADGCRLERQQRAEEAAQKAAVKILFPTLLCIFPAIFIVLLGPAAYQVASLMSKTR
jgi:tight adherence protein C